jgi:hypothetical protein
MTAATLEQMRARTDWGNLLSSWRDLTRGRVGGLIYGATAGTASPDPCPDKFGAVPLALMLDTERCMRASRTQSSDLPLSAVLSALNRCQNCES